MRNRIIVVMLVAVALAVGAASRAQLQPKGGPIVYMEGDRIQVRGTGDNRYLLVETEVKGSRRIFAYQVQLGRATICPLGQPCEPCEPGGCVEPPPPIMDPICGLNVPKPCILGMWPPLSPR